MKVRYLNKLSQLEQIPASLAEKLETVAEKYAFRTNDYYNSLINWEDPDDPIKRLVIPVEDELINWGQLDASSEKLYQPVHGVEHKYRDTVLLLCNDVCAAYCRFCFRKRLFQDDNDEVSKDVTQGIAYIKDHPEVTNVLLTGGDPLIMSTPRLEGIISMLAEIPHVQIIRIGSKVPAFNPHRILDDDSLISMLRLYVQKKQIYVMAHFNHPVELTDTAIKALRILKQAGVSVVNQTPIIRGVNDKVEVLGKLFNQLSFIGIQPYYVFACRPTEGNKTFAVPVEEAFTIFRDAVRTKAGLAKTARFVLSHKIGKIEVVGLTEDQILFRYHNLVESEKNGSIVMYPRNPEAYWLDDYQTVSVMI